jgi:ribose 5-phosphate isomerase B
MNSGSIGRSHAFRNRDEILKIAMAADHAGFALKEQLKKKIIEAGHTVADVGAHSADPSDYPDFGYLAACMIAEERADRGIFCCGTGAGMAITANRLPGIRAVVCFTVEITRLARAHNDANILCLPARFVDAEMAWQIVQVFLTEPFEGGRHLRRIQKIDRNTSCE